MSALIRHNAKLELLNELGHELVAWQKIRDRYRYPDVDFPENIFLEAAVFVLADLAREVRDLLHD